MNNDSAESTSLDDASTLSSTTPSHFGLTSTTDHEIMRFAEFVQKLNEVNSQYLYYLNLQNRKTSSESAKNSTGTINDDRDAYEDDEGEAEGEGESNDDEEKKKSEYFDIAYEYLRADFEDLTWLQFNRLYERNLWVANTHRQQFISRLHHDSAENLLCIVDGVKKLILYSPANSGFLYPFEVRQQHFSQVDIDDPDFATFPLFSQAKALHCQAGPGDVLYLPSHWWHQVYSDGLSIEKPLNIALNFWFTPLTPIQHVITGFRILLSDYTSSFFQYL